MKEVNAELYEFLKNHETGLSQDCKTNIITAYVLIDFCDIQDFIDAIGVYWFDEGGLDCKLLNGYIGIDINDIIEAEGHNLSSYKNCFEKHDWDCFKEEIEEMER